MSQNLLTEVTATVPEGHEHAVLTAFVDLVHGRLPDGLLRTELLSGPDGQWRIQSLWRDQAALDAMRASPEPPAAPALFRSVGAEPSLRILTVRGTHAVS